MKNTNLWRVQTTVSAEAEDGIGALMEQITEQRPASFRKEGADVVCLSVHLTRRFEWTPESRQSWQTGLAILRACGIKTGPCRWVVSPVKKEDWAESWKKHFPPLVIGNQLLVKPGWSKRKARKGMVEVILDPGLSFGTGQHPTTAFCLEQIAECASETVPGALLDMGTGSGILAIAAAKLGYNPVQAFDFDPDCIKVSLENAERNQVESLVKFSQQDLTKLRLERKPSFDLICANLEYPLLMSESARIDTRLKPGGRLVLAGILKRQFPSVQQHYTALGYRLVASKALGEWRSGAFAKGNKKAG